VSFGLKTIKRNAPLLYYDKDSIVQFVRYAAYGDILMLTALFPALKRLDVELRAVCFSSSPAKSILEDNPHLDHLIILPDDCPNNMDDIDNYTASLLGKRATHTFSMDYPQWWGWSAPPGLPPVPLNQHMIAYFCQEVGVPFCDELSVHLTPEMQEWAKRYSDYILIQTKSSHSPYKDWPLQNWHQLCQLLQQKLGLKIGQLGSSNDPEIPGVEKINAPCIRHAIAALKASRLFIGLDSVFNHASKAVNKQSIILWGSTNPVAYGYSQNINLVNGVLWEPSMGNGAPLLRCQPCYRENKHIEWSQDLACPYTVANSSQGASFTVESPTIHACMSGNTVTAVYTQILTYLNKQGISARP